jgi:hypothetical protein
MAPHLVAARLILAIIFDGHVTPRAKMKRRPGGGAKAKKTTLNYDGRVLICKVLVLWKACGEM